MPVTVVQTKSISAGNIQIKFGLTVDIDTLVKSNFTLALNSATPSLITDPFEDIVVSRDYDSISRRLTLWLKHPLVSLGVYTLTMTNLKTPYQEVIPTTLVSLTAPQDVSVDLLDQVPIPDPVIIEDISIRDTTALSLTYPITTSDEDQLIVKNVVPDLITSAYLEESFNEGRIEVFFNTIIAANYVSSDYFKVQRKTVGRGMARWEELDTIVTSDSNSGIVIIYLPSIEETPVYGEPDRIYWEKGYKYRLRISGAIGSATDEVYLPEPSNDIDGGSP